MMEMRLVIGETCRQRNLILWDGLWRRRKERRRRRHERKKPKNWQAGTQTLAIHKTLRWIGSNTKKIVTIKCQTHGDPRQARSPSHGSKDGMHLRSGTLTLHLSQRQAVCISSNSMPLLADVLHLRLTSHSPQNQLWNTTSSLEPYWFGIILVPMCLGKHVPRPIE